LEFSGDFGFEELPNLTVLKTLFFQCVHKLVDNLHRLLLGDTLAKSTRDLLVQWMVKNTYGDTAFVPTFQTAGGQGDKTRANGTTTTNDISIYWPDGRAPLLVSVYLIECPRTDAKRMQSSPRLGNWSLLRCSNMC